MDRPTDEKGRFVASFVSIYSIPYYLKTFLNALNKKYRVKVQEADMMYRFIQGVFR